MKENVVKIKSLEFAIKIVKLSQFLIAEKREFVLSRQIMRSGTAIGALVRESEFGASKKDFVNKLQIALKETNETEYWLELLRMGDFIDENRYTELKDNCNELLRILISIIKTSKQNL